NTLLVGNGPPYAHLAGRAAVDRGQRHLEHYLLLARDAQQVHDIRFARQDVVGQVRPHLTLWNAGDEREVADRVGVRQVEVDIGPSRRIVQHRVLSGLLSVAAAKDLKDARGLNRILDFAADDQLVADQGQADVGIGESPVDLVLQRLVHRLQAALDVRVGQ